MIYKVKNWKGPLIVLLFGLALISTFYISFSQIGTIKTINSYFDNNSNNFEINLNDHEEFPFAIAFSWDNTLITSEEVCSI